VLNDMPPRQKYLAMATTILVVFAIAWSMGLEESFDAMTSGTTDVGSLQTDFEENLAVLAKMPEVEREYLRIGDIPGQAGDKNLRPALAFQQEVSDICTNLGFQFPPIVAKVEEIKGVEDYQLVKVELRTEGTFQNTVNLLKEFENRGLIFRDVDLQSARDRDNITARLILARIAQRITRGPRGTTRLNR